jgi:serine/threonine-protein kinase RsbW
MRSTTRLTLPRRPPSVTYARHVLEALLPWSQVADHCREQLALLITEACSNAVVHAAGGTDMEVGITIDPVECVVEVGNRDGPDRREVASVIPDPMSERGRGLPLISAIADSARFISTRPGWVVLRMVKRLTPAPPIGLADAAGR